MPKKNEVIIKIDPEDTLKILYFWGKPYSQFTEEDKYSYRNLKDRLGTSVCMEFIKK